MKNIMFAIFLFCGILLIGCADSRDKTDTEEIPPMQEGLNQIVGTPPADVPVHPKTPGELETTMSNVSEREIEQYVKINRRLESLNIRQGQDSNTEMNRLVREEGLTLERYHEIGVSLQDDPVLQDKMIRYQNENKR